MIDIKSFSSMPDIELFNGLRDRDYKSEGRVVGEGRIVIEKMLETRMEIECLLCATEEKQGWIVKSNGKFPVVACEGPKLRQLLGYKFHRGSIAIARRPKIEISSKKTIYPDSNILVMWNITDPDNLGTLIRSASALGFSVIALGPGCADPFYRKTVRSSMGNVFSCKMYYITREDFLQFREQHIKIIAATTKDDTLKPQELKKLKSIALVLGNEGYGIPSDILSLCDEYVTIPMSPKTDSLNVASAGAILMYCANGNK